MNSQYDGINKFWEITQTVTQDKSYNIRNFVNIKLFKIYASAAVFTWADSNSKAS